MNESSVDKIAAKLCNGDCLGVDLEEEENSQKDYEKDEKQNHDDCADIIDKGFEFDAEEFVKFWVELTDAGQPNRNDGVFSRLKPVVDSGPVFIIPLILEVGEDSENLAQLLQAVKSDRNETQEHNPNLAP